MRDWTEIHREIRETLSGCGNPGGRGTLLDKPYRYVPPQRVGFLSRFGLKTGTDFVHFGLESGTIFEGTS